MSMTTVDRSEAAGDPAAAYVRLMFQATLHMSHPGLFPPPVMRLKALTPVEEALADESGPYVPRGTRVMRAHHVRVEGTQSGPMFRRGHIPAERGQ